MVTTSSFKIEGYFEELYDPVSRKSLGTRFYDSLPKNRQLGEEGAITSIFPEDVVVDRGHKKGILIRTKGKTIKSIFQICCGQRIRI